jgi:hypothetical protein
MTLPVLLVGCVEVVMTPSHGLAWRMSRVHAMRSPKVHPVDPGCAAAPDLSLWAPLSPPGRSPAPLQGSRRGGNGWFFIISE